MATLYGSWDEGGPYKVERLLMFEPYHDYGPWEVQTIAGVARAPLERACGFSDGYPPLAAAFDRPGGIALYQGKPSLQLANESIYVADAGNNVIRKITAVCSQPCENGGVCIGPEKCQCQEGWGGSDCAAPICTAAAKLLNFGASIIEFAGFSRRRLLMASDEPTQVPTSYPSSSPYPTRIDTKPPVPGCWCFMLDS